MYPSSVVVACVVALAATYAFIARHRRAAALADLSGRVVVICGASQGIARELALHYARARCRLVLSSRNAKLLEELAQHCKSLGAQEALVFPADFANDKSAEHLVAFVTSHYNCMDILVLNMIKPFYGPWSSVTSVQSVREQFDVGFFGYLSCFMASQRLLERARGGGRVLVVSSMASIMPLKNVAPYAAMKSAVVTLFQDIELELQWAGTPISFTTAILGFIGTDNAITTTSKVALPKVKAEDPSETALAMLLACALRHRIMFFPFTARLTHWMVWAAPALMRQVALRLQ